MKKRIISLFVTLCMLLTLLPTVALGAGEAWDGTTITPVTPDAKGDYTITTGAELAWVAQVANACNESNGTIFEDVTVRLANDIDLGNHPWTPIGEGVVVQSTHGNSMSTSFDGTFDGGGFTVSGLSVGTQEAPYTGGYVGLFGRIESNRNIKNVTVKGATYSSHDTTHGSGAAYAGLLGGYLNATVTGTSLQNCHAVGTVNVSTTDGSSNSIYAGGLVGLTDFVMDDCSAVSQEGTPDGALVKYTMAIEEHLTYLGGLVGAYIAKQMTNSFAVGTVALASTATGTTRKQCLGGLFGGSTSSTENHLIKNCFARTNVTVTGTLSGTITGPLTSSTPCGIQNSYFAGTLVAGTPDYIVYKTSSTDKGTTEQSIKDYFNADLNAVIKAKNSVRPRPLMMKSWVTNSENGGLPALGNSEFTPDWADEGVTAVEGEDYTYNATTKIATVKTAKGLGWFSANYFPKLSADPFTLLLENDIDLAGKQWVPLGCELKANTINFQFAGVLDGQGHTISNMNIGTETQPTALYSAGLVSVVGSGAAVMNLGLTGAVFTDSEGGAGGIAGANRGKIINCFSTVAAVNRNAAGTASPLAGVMKGIMGFPNGTIINSFSANASGGAYFGNVCAVLVGAPKTTDELQSPAFVTLLHTTAQGVVNQHPAPVRALYGWEAESGKAPKFGAVLTRTPDWMDVANGVGGEAAAAAGTDYTVSADSKTYTIQTAKGLAWVAAQTYAGNNFKGKTVALDPNCTFDLSAHSWVPIGVVTSSVPDGAFQGTFHGNEVPITGLNMNNNLGINYDDLGVFSCYGLFGVTDGATIKDVTIDAPAISATGGNLMMGALIGRKTEGSVDNCHVTGGTISATSDSAMNVGGLVGYNQGCVILNSSSNSALSMSFSGGDTDTSSNGTYEDKSLGGIVGSTTHREEQLCVLNCWSRSTLTVTDGNAAGENNAWYTVGGVAGQVLEEHVINNYFAGTITVPDTLDNTEAVVGGVVGIDDGATIKHNFYQTGVAVQGIGSKTSAEDAAQTAPKTVAELKALDATLNDSATIAEINGIVASLAGKLAARYWKVDAGLNDGYPVHRVPETITTQPTTESLTVAATTANGAPAYQWQEQKILDVPSLDKWAWSESDGAWKSQTAGQDNTKAVLRGAITADSEGKIAFDWKASSESVSYDYLYYTLYSDPAYSTKVTGGTGTKIGGAGADFAAVSLTGLTTGIEYYLEFAYKKDGMDSAGSDCGWVKFKETQPMQSLSWANITGATASTLTPTGLAEGTSVRCLVSYPWGETLTSDTAEIGASAPGCTCTVSAPTFADATIEIPAAADTATYTLAASGSTLSGGCGVSTHSGATVTYSYTETSNIASISGSTLTVTGVGSVSVTATATANGVTATTDATFTVTKVATAADTYKLKFDADESLYLTTPIFPGTGEQTVTPSLGEDYTFTLTADANHTLPKTISLFKQDGNNPNLVLGTDYTYDSTTGVVVLKGTSALLTKNALIEFGAIGSITTATQLQTALGGSGFATVTGNTVALTKDSSISAEGSQDSAYLNIESAALTLNLDGHALTLNDYTTISPLASGGLTLENGTIAGDGLASNQGGTLTIKSGTYQRVYIYDGTATIDGGTFEEVWVFNPEEDCHPVLTVNGGTFTASIASMYGTLTITGGDFQDEGVMVVGTTVEAPTQIAAGTFAKFRATNGDDTPQTLADCIKSGSKVYKYDDTTKGDELTGTALAVDTYATPFLVEADPTSATAPSITTTSLPGGTVGTAYSQTLAATGTAPITWSVTTGTLPAGLTLTAGTGVISGTPTTAGTATFTVTASNGTLPNATKALSIAIVAAAPAYTYTVTFDSQGATVAASPASKTVTAPATTVVTLPTPPTKTNHTFGGWYTAVNGDGTKFEANTTVYASLTVYAKWTENTYEVGGEVTDGTDAVDGAKVQLKQGKNQIGTDKFTSADGKYSFTGIPAGAYNVVATKGDKTVTLLVNVVNADLTNQNLTMPTKEVSSKLEVQAGAPDAVVGGLDTIANGETVAANTKVTIQLTVKAELATAPGATAIKQLLPSEKKAEFLDLKLEKLVTDTSTTTTTTEDLGDSNTTVLELVIPYDFTDKESVTVYRHHNGTATALTALNARPSPAYADGTFFADQANGLIYIYAKKFSTYAVAYTEVVVTPPPTPSDSGSDVISYVITASAGTGGTITPKGTVRVDKGGKKTFTVKPNEGYVLADLLVDGKSVLGDVTMDGTKGTYTFQKVTAKHTIEATFRQEEEKQENPFTDISPEDWFYDTVLDVADKGLMDGLGDNRFGPLLSTDRAMIVTILHRMKGTPAAKSGAGFPDVPADVWYAGAVLWGQETAVVKGYGDGRFGPTDPISREQLVTFLWRYAGSPELTATQAAPTFSDTQSVSPWAAKAVSWATAQGLLKGRPDGTLDPLGNATRAETAALLLRFLEAQPKAN